LLRIVLNVHHLGMTRTIAADHTVGRIRDRSAAVADRYVHHAWHLTECLLDAPEAARTKHRLLDSHLFTAAPGRAMIICSAYSWILSRLASVFGHVKSMKG
jgi:hypothetical protein